MPEDIDGILSLEAESKIARGGLLVSSLTSEYLSAIFNELPLIISLRHVPHNDTTGVRSMACMFSGCWAQAQIPPFDTRLLESMEGMFSGCYGLITVPLLNTEAVQRMTYTFSGCYRLMNLPALPVGNVSDFNGVFSSCVGLAWAPLQGIATTISFWGCALSKAAILTIFQNLAYVSNGQSIDVGSNSGTNELSTADLAAAAVRDLIAQPADDFNAAAQRVLNKNAELYRRLA